MISFENRDLGIIFHNYSFWFAVRNWSYIQMKIWLADAIIFLIFRVFTTHSLLYKVRYQYALCPSVWLVRKRKVWWLGPTLLGWFCPTSFWRTTTINGRPFCCMATPVVLGTMAEPMLAHDSARLVSSRFILLVYPREGTQAEHEHSMQGSPPWLDPPYFECSPLTSKARRVLNFVQFGRPESAVTKFCFSQQVFLRRHKECPWWMECRMPRHPSRLLWSPNRPVREERSRCMQGCAEYRSQLHPFDCRLWRYSVIVIWLNGHGVLTLVLLVVADKNWPDDYYGTILLVNSETCAASGVAGQMGPLTVNNQQHSL